jgi:hypothetical protein
LTRTVIEFSRFITTSMRIEISPPRIFLMEHRSTMERIVSTVVKVKELWFLEPLLI